MAQFGTVTEIDLDFGGDFSLQANGDLLLAQNSTSSTIATQQRLQRLLLSCPYIAGLNRAPTDIFHRTYGAGLPNLVGQPVTAAFTANIQAVITKALLADPTVASIQTISVNPIPGQQTGTNGIVVNIKLTASSGKPLTLQLPIPG